VAYSSCPKFFVNDIRHAREWRRHPLEEENLDASGITRERPSDTEFKGWTHVEKLRKQVDIPEQIRCRPKTLEGLSDSTARAISAALRPKAGILSEVRRQPNAVEGPYE